MHNMILIDLETQSFSVESGIYEVAAIVVEDYKVKEKFYLGIVEDESFINEGYGFGYEDISANESCIEEFKKFIGKYQYPLVAHNGAFDRKFLVHYGWIDEGYPFYDSIRAIKYSNPKLFSYSIEYLKDFLDIDKEQTHTAIEDVEMLYEILNEFKPDRWIPIGVQSNNSNHSYKNSLTSIKQDFEVIMNLFAGRNIVFTGKGPYTRNQLMELAKKCGADITSNSITKKTNLLVVGEDAGSKLQKAQDLGIEIMAMDDFYHMVHGIELDEKMKVTIENVVSNKELVILTNKLSGQTITLSPMKGSIATKVAKVIEQHGGVPLYTFRKKETTLVVYQPYGEEMATIKKARDLNIPTMTIGKFNKYLIELEKNIEE
ncbi:MAG TPA: DNA polymerase III subunit epsilon [Clostridium sp.]|nr:DNA polymerase III subunit epsilon [Clostridium sp.]